MATKQALKPQALRSTLVVVLILIIAGGAGLFYLGLNEIRTFATEVNLTVADADASGTQVQSLQKLKAQLAQSDTLIAKANQMFATPASYQDQAITDVQNYARAAGLSVAKTSIEEATPGTNPAVIVSFKTPVTYSKLIKFLNGIEGNMPKMQVSSIGLNHVNGGGADSVKVDDIKITIAVR